MSLILEDRYYEDEYSLKKWMRGLVPAHKDLLNTIFLDNINSGGAGAEIELHEKADCTISEMGKLEETWVCAASHDVAALQSKHVYITYKNAAGTEKSVTFTTGATATDEVAASTPITDGYVPISVTTDAVIPTGKTIKIGVTGLATPVATLTEGETSCTDAELTNLNGVIYGRASATAAGYLGKELYLDYVTPWFELKSCICIMDATNAETEIKFFDAETGLVSVKDFYRVVNFTSEVVAGAGDWFIITDDACSNVDGSGSDIYGVIESGFTQSIHSRFEVKSTGKAFLISVEAQYLGATDEYCDVLIKYTTKGRAEYTKTKRIYGGETFKWSPCFELEPSTEVTFSIKDDAAAGGDVEFESHIVETYDTLVSL